MRNKKQQLKNQDLGLSVNVDMACELVQISTQQSMLESHYGVKNVPHTQEAKPQAGVLTETRRQAQLTATHSPP